MTANPSSAFGDRVTLLAAGVEPLPQSLLRDALRRRTRRRWQDLAEEAEGGRQEFPARRREAAALGEDGPLALALSCQPLVHRGIRPASEQHLERRFSSSASALPAPHAKRE